MGRVERLWPFPASSYKKDREVQLIVRVRLKTTRACDIRGPTSKITVYNNTLNLKPKTGRQGLEPEA